MKMMKVEHEKKTAPATPPGTAALEAAPPEAAEGKSSIQDSTAETTTTRSSPCNSCCFLSRCCCFHNRDQPFMDGNRQAIAFLLDSIATSIIFSGSGAFLIPALIKLAKEEAGCEFEAPQGESKAPECHEKVYGLKPSSLISTYATVIGLAAALATPLAGAIVDTTHYRRGLGRITVFLFLAMLFPTIFVDHDNWFAISLMFAVLGFVGLVETMLLYSYLPELTDDEAKLIKYTRTFNTGTFSCMVLFLGFVVGLSSGVYGNDKTTLDDEIQTARLSQSMAFGIGFVLFSIAWGRLFAARPPARVLTDEESIWFTGFQQIYRTAVKVHNHYPALQWFFVAIAFSDAATSALLVIGITFMTEVLEFSGAENGTVIVIMLLSCVFGGFFSSCVSKRSNPVTSSVVAVVILIVNTTLVAAIVDGPDMSAFAYALAVPWGIGTGWKWTVDRLLYARILPAGQNAEFSGTFVFFRQSLTWLPPLIFTFINESSDISLQWGVASINIFLVISLLIYVFGVGMGRYSAAVAAANAGSDAEGNPEERPKEDAETAEEPQVLID